MLWSLLRGEGEVMEDDDVEGEGGGRLPPLTGREEVGTVF